MSQSESDSLERIVPDSLQGNEATGQETLRLHLERYHFAARHLVPGTALDLACGVGYGSAILAGASPARHVVAADLSPDALRHARAAYTHPRVSFLRGNGGAWSRGSSFDNIVSLETLEHVPHPGQFFDELVSLLKPGGRLIVSVPTTPSVDANPHHRTDFTERSFLALGRQRDLEVLALLRQVQKYSPIAVALRRERRTRDLRRGLARYYLEHPGAAVRRLRSILIDGFRNRYLTVVWGRPERV